MSIERELLQTALGILEDYEWGYGGDHHKSPEASILNDIRKLLAQPEQDLEVLKKDWVNFGYEAGRKSALSKQEPLTPRQGLEEYKRGYAQAELDLKRQPLTNENSDTVSAFNPVSNNYWSR